MIVRYQSLAASTLSSVVCCPGGLELAGKSFLGDVGAVTRWHRQRMAEGMRGVVAYADGAPRGFAEYASADVAPFPIEAPGAATLLCFHWAGTEADDPEHLAQERRMIETVISETRPRFTGLAALGWNHPTHYPILLLQELGFRELERQDPIALLWLPFSESATPPRLARPRFQPRDLRDEGLLAIDQAWSSRCPYSIHFAERVKLAVEGIPDPSRVHLRRYRIDTRSDAFRFAVSPWDWGWIYLNGESINPFALPGERLAGEIVRHIPSSAVPTSPGN